MTENETEKRQTLEKRILSLLQQAASMTSRGEFERINTELNAMDLSLLMVSDENRAKADRDRSKVFEGIRNAC